MNVKKRRTIWCVVLLVLLSAWAVDRFVIPPPSEAEGAEGDTAHPAAAGVRGAPAGPTGIELGPRAALERLLAGTPRTEQPAAGTAVKDVFDVRRLLAGAEGEAMRSGIPAADRGAEFRQSHSLHATVLGPAPLALVGDVTLRIGERLDAFVLKSIGPRSAVFACGEVEVELHIPPRTEGKTAPGGN